jgi:transposase
MRLQIVRSKNASSFYVVESTREKGKRTNRVVERLGTLEEVKAKADGGDPVEWAKQYAARLTELDREGKREINVRYSPAEQLCKGEQRLYNGGYLFIQQIYYSLGIDKMCAEITKRHQFEYDLNDILSKLVYCRILYPSSKLATYELSKRLLQQPNFGLQQIYRSLDVLASESDYIQSTLYANSLAVSERKSTVLYYDCTNYYFEIEQEEGIKQYGHSKEHRPNPIVQMGLFMDGNGIPLAFCINPGNTNEQTTLSPLEEKILEDFRLSKMIVCTDAGLSSTNNRKFNTQGERAFITVQAVKKLKKYLREDFALQPGGWKLPGGKEEYDITKVDETACHDQTFYKERWIHEDGLEQRLVVTNSIKYRNYQRQIRERQLNRAMKAVEKGEKEVDRYNPNDYKRFIKKTAITEDGEVAGRKVYGIDESAVEKEAQYDGVYAICTNLEGNVTEIIAINHRRWEIEESFRIMKSEFRARPVFLHKDQRIKAHFITCFIALTLYRLLEKKLCGKFTCADIISTLREMSFTAERGEAYRPVYMRTEVTDALHDASGFRTDYQILISRQVKKILKETMRP